MGIVAEIRTVCIRLYFLAAALPRHPTATSSDHRSPMAVDPPSPSAMYTPSPPPSLDAVSTPRRVPAASGLVVIARPRHRMPYTSRYHPLRRPRRTMA